MVLSWWVHLMINVILLMVLSNCFAKTGDIYVGNVG